MAPIFTEALPSLSSADGQPERLVITDLSLGIAHPTAPEHFPCSSSSASFVGFQLTTGGKAAKHPLNLQVTKNST